MLTQTVTPIVFYILLEEGILWSGNFCLIMQIMNPALYNKADNYFLTLLYLILYLSTLLHYYTLHKIILFPSRCNLEKLIRTLAFLATCFGPIWPSSGVSSYAKTVKLR
jgi:hypothetical protein